MRTVVVGAGAAGLWTALHAATRGDAVIVAPDPTAASSTALAQGGIAAAVAEGDDPGAHARDTLAAGAGLCDPRAVRVLTENAPLAIQELRAAGMAFDQSGAPTLEGGHSARRVLHAGGDATGRVLLRTLLEAVRSIDAIRWVDGRAGALLLGGEVPAVAGVRTDAGEEIEADRVVLATGGACGIFGRRTGPERATGQGLALAWEAGAALADLEFVQFHPTALDVPGRPARLLTEALRGEGAVLLDADGDRFMDRFDPRAELAPRDVVARAIAAVRAASGRPVSLDATGIPEVTARFPTVAASCAEAGLDLARDRIPVAPAAHYFTGGIWTDTWGRSTVRGLSACGECACTGVHGANRLASNSLLEALVFGRRAAVAEDADGPDLPSVVAEADPAGGCMPLAELRPLADADLGVSRDARGLRAIAAELARAAPGRDAVARPATLVASLLAAAALRREESRGGHFRRDFARSDPAWRVRQAVSRTGWRLIPARAQP